MNLSQAARLLDLSVRTVGRRIQSGELFAWRDGGRVIVPDEAVAAYVARRRPVVPFGRGGARLGVTQEHVREVFPGLFRASPQGYARTSQGAGPAVTGGARARRDAGVFTSSRTKGAC